MKPKEREHIYIVPHWAGLVFGFLVLVVFSISFVDSGLGWVRTLGIVLVIAGIVVLIQSNENLRGVEVVGCLCAPCAAGDTAMLELSLFKRSADETIGLKVRPRSRGVRHAEMPVPVMFRGVTTHVRIPVHAPRRGRFPVPQIRVSSVMPAGLCYAWKSFTGLGDYVVYPAPRGRLLGDFASAGNRAGGGVRVGGEDVSGHQPYLPGDPISRIDWRVFARNGKLVSRSRDGAGSGEILLTWGDTDFLTDPEQRLEQLSFWVDQCTREGRRFHLLLDPAGDPISGKDLVACRTALAEFQTG